MDNNFETVVTDMLAAMKEILADNYPKVESVAKQCVQAKEKRWNMLSEYYRTGKITQQQFEARLEDEKRIFEAELNALKVVSKSLVQKAIRAAFEVLIIAVRVAI
jgi:hypothetical protein